MNQTPCYYESESASTIKAKGSRQVFLRKSMGHKRFTATFTISQEGKIYRPHCLFSKLVKNPKVNPNVMVDVNNTGMWNQGTLKSYMDNFVIKRHETNKHSKNLCF